MNSSQRVGARIKQLREENSIKQTRLAKDLSISVQTLSAIENGKCEITLGRLEQLSKIFEKSIFEIVEVYPADFQPDSITCLRETLDTNGVVTEKQINESELFKLNKKIISMLERIINLLENEPIK